MKCKVQNTLRLLISSLIVSFILSNCSQYADPGKTVLAPTPLAVAYGKVASATKIKSVDLGKKVPVFICSSRNLEPESDRIHRFGNKRSGKLVPYLALGQVSFHNKKGVSDFRLESLTVVNKKRTRVELVDVGMYPSPEVTPYSTDSEKFKSFAANTWLKAIKAQLNKGKSKTITIFVHGYNTHLVSNTELLAELYHYAGRDGAVVNYEWPSAGKLLGYFKDKGNAEHSTRLFRSFISRIAYFTGAKKVRIIAHSAGNPIVVNALKELRMLNKDLTPAQLHAKFKISQVIMAAPDMDSMRFMNAVFDGFHEITPSVSVYAFPKDKALRAATKVFGVTRLGNSIGKFKGWEKAALQRAKNIEMIDVTVPQNKYGSWLGHGYFHRDPWVSSDILLSGHKSKAAQRGLVRKEGAIFWEFPKDYPERLKKLK